MPLASGESGIDIGERAGVAVAPVNLFSLPRVLRATVAATGFI